MATEKNEIAIELLEILPRLVRQLHATILATSEKAATPDELQELEDLRATPGQVTLLGILARKELATMQELATLLVVTPGAMTMMVKRLLAQGYVERQRDEQDWRLVWITLTERGKQVIQRYREVRLGAMEDQLAQLSVEEQEHLQQALPALRHLLELSRL